MGAPLREMLSRGLVWGLPSGCLLGFLERSLGSGDCGFRVLDLVLQFSLLIESRELLDHRLVLVGSRLRAKPHEVLCRSPDQLLQGEGAVWARRGHSRDLLLGVCVVGGSLGLWCVVFVFLRGGRCHESLLLVVGLLP